MAINLWATYESIKSTRRKLEQLLRRKEALERALKNKEKKTLKEYQESVSQKQRLEEISKKLKAKQQMPIAPNSVEAIMGKKRGIQEFKKFERERREFLKSYSDYQKTYAQYRQTVQKANVEYQTLRNLAGQYQLGYMASQRELMEKVKARQIKANGLQSSKIKVPEVRATSQSITSPKSTSGTITPDAWAPTPKGVRIVKSVEVEPGVYATFYEVPVSNMPGQKVTLIDYRVDTNRIKQLQAQKEKYYEQQFMAEMKQKFETLPLKEKVKIGIAPLFDEEGFGRLVFEVGKRGVNPMLIKKDIEDFKAGKNIYLDIALQSYYRALQKAEELQEAKRKGGFEYAKTAFKYAVLENPLANLGLQLGVYKVVGFVAGTGRGVISNLLIKQGSKFVDVGLNLEKAFDVGMLGLGTYSTATEVKEMRKLAKEGKVGTATFKALSLGTQFYGFASGMRSGERFIKSKIGDYNFITIQKSGRIPTIRRVEGSPIVKAYALQEKPLFRANLEGMKIEEGIYKVNNKVKFGEKYSVKLDTPTARGQGAIFKGIAEVGIQLRETGQVLRPQTIKFEGFSSFMVSDMISKSGVQFYKGKGEVVLAGRKGLEREGFIFKGFGKKDRFITATQFEEGFGLTVGKRGKGFSVSFSPGKGGSVKGVSMFKGDKQVGSIIPYQDKSAKFWKGIMRLPRYEEVFKFASAEKELYLGRFGKFRREGVNVGSEVFKPEVDPLKRMVINARPRRNVLKELGEAYKEENGREIENLFENQVKEVGKEINKQLGKSKVKSKGYLEPSPYAGRGATIIEEIKAEPILFGEVNKGATEFALSRLVRTELKPDLGFNFKPAFTFDVSKIFKFKRSKKSKGSVALLPRFKQEMDLSVKPKRGILPDQKISPKRATTTTTTTTELITITTPPNLKFPVPEEGKGGRGTPKIGFPVIVPPGKVPSFFPGGLDFGFGLSGLGFGKKVKSKRKYTPSVAGLGLGIKTSKKQSPIRFNPFEIRPLLSSKKKSKKMRKKSKKRR